MTVSGQRAILQCEGLAVLVGTIVAYKVAGYSWALFACLILAPDLSLLGYFGGNKVGAVVYNTVHCYVFAVALLIVSWFAQLPVGMAVGLVWAAHIGMDRAIGFGLKYSDGPKTTHFDKV